MFESLEKMDVVMTRWLERNVGMNDNKWLSWIPYYLGLVPYELYALPGMYIFIVAACYYQSFMPMIVHLIPQWAAYSAVSLLKNHVKRTRPGCHLRNRHKLKFLDKKHCEGCQRTRSFPSGHTIIATTLATSLCYYLYDPTISPDDKNVLGVAPVGTGVARQVVAAFAIFAAFMVAIQRVSHGFHHVSDVCVGAALGYGIASLTYVVCMKARGVMLAGSAEINQWNVLSGLAIALAMLGLVHFLLYELPKLLKVGGGGGKG